MTCVQVLTPPGRAAIAVVEVAGPAAATMLDRWFVAVNGKPASQQPINAIRFGTWIASRGGVPDASVPGEELVLVRTATDRAEVHCHGGVAASAAIVETLVASGAVQSTDGEPRSIAEDARVALTHAPTERVAGILLDQANGALTASLSEVVDRVESGEIEAASQQIATLLQHERLGRRLVTPWRVVLAGPPNVGKSSLINALVGYDRALVYDQPGTTRDVVTTATAIGGWPVTLADTAGVRETTDPLEAAGVELAQRTLGTADIVVVVREAAMIGSAEDAIIRGSLQLDVPTEAVIVEVANKSDQLPAGATVPSELLATNAPAGIGMDALLAAIEQAMAVVVPPLGTAVPFRPGHYRQLRAVRESLGSNERAEAVAMLQALLAGAKP